MPEKIRIDTPIATKMSNALTPIPPAMFSLMFLFSPKTPNNNKGIGEHIKSKTPSPNLGALFSTSFI